VAGYIDITRTISSEMEVYPADPAVEISAFKSLDKGNSCNLSRLTMGSHTGTHIDAPRHILREGRTLDTIDIEDLICRVAVADKAIFADETFFDGLRDKGVKGILLKDSNGKEVITKEEACILVENNIRLIGTEAMSIEDSTDKSHPVHRLLLGAGVIIIEGLDLKDAKKGFYKLMCLPLKVKDGDGAPLRAVLEYD